MADEPKCYSFATQIGYFYPDFLRSQAAIALPKCYSLDRQQITDTRIFSPKKFGQVDQYNNHFYNFYPQNLPKLCLIGGR
ncbi:hypothetical protein [Nostoc sp.]|uniref:hypothetical protein n=1 Tax=Nostoc sp. TaxID=1180 RepID=UPI002FF67EA9